MNQVPINTIEIIAESENEAMEI
ncbi:uncharacterized protein METZ01_LOCUS328187, partial [marine metagenome]